MEFCHTFASPWHVLHPHVAGLHIMGHARTPVDRYCVLSHVSAHVTVSPRWYLEGVRVNLINDTAWRVVYTTYPGDKSCCYFGICVITRVVYSRGVVYNIYTDKHSRIW